MGANDETFRIRLETEGKEGLRDLGKEAGTAAEKLDTAGEAAEKLDTKTKTSTANMGRSFLEIGRVVQDFAQGGIGGILNNIEGLTRALGGGPGLAGVATVAGVTIGLLGPKIISTFKSMGAADADLKPLKEQIDAVKTSLDKLAEKQSLTNKEMSEYNKLAAEQGRLDKQSAENKARLAAMAVQPGERTQKDRSLGEKVTDVAAGHQGDIVAGAAELLGDSAAGRYYEKYGDRIRILRAKESDAQASRFEIAERKQLEAGADTARAGGAVEAQNLLAKAMSGDAEAARKLIAVMPQGTLRDDMVRATISDRTKDEARFQASQFLDSMIGQAARGLRDRNQANKTARDAQANTFEIDKQMDEAKADRDRKADAEQKRADAETQRFREQANRAQEQAAVRHVERSQDLGQRVSKAWEKPGLGFTPDTHRLKPIGPNDDPEEVIRGNQGIMNKQLMDAVKSMGVAGAQKDQAAMQAIVATFQANTAQMQQAQVGFQQLAQQLNQRTQGVNVTLRRGNR